MSHRAECTANQYRSGILVVFVHGMLGDPRTSWAELPRWSLERSGVDVDVFSFGYPSTLWRQATVRQAARNLRVALEDVFPEYGHLLFVAHGTGGLIVKQLLLECRTDFAVGSEA